MFKEINIDTMNSLRYTLITIDNQNEKVKLNTDYHYWMTCAHTSEG